LYFEKKINKLQRERYASMQLEPYHAAHHDLCLAHHLVLVAPVHFKSKEKIKNFKI